MNTPRATADHDGSATAYGRHAGFVVDRARDLVDMLDLPAGARVLDLGCGDGAMSAVLVDRGWQVTGIDASPAMITAAAERGIAARVLDGHDLIDHAPGERYDAVFSNAALHWMARDPDRVLAGVRQALRPGGQFVAEFGGQGNIAPIHAALREIAEQHGQDADRLDPWFFPSVEDYRARLAGAGFEIRHIERFDRPTELPGEMADWLNTLARPFITAFAPGETRDAYIADVVERLRPDLCDTQGRWHAPYVRLRLAAHKPYRVPPQAPHQEETHASIHDS